jgi:Fic-DOC domain mobile mystery protein B
MVELSYPDGATPLDPDEAEGLIPSHVTTQQQLNEWEEANILAGQQWALSRPKLDLLTLDGVKKLHLHMFDETWSWAGQFRTTGKNLGVEWPTIPSEITNACNDAKAWIEFNAYPPPELAARLQHRLVSIHPFPNGNGRHSRLLTDLVLHRLGLPPASWGGRNLVADSHFRKDYIRALRIADEGNFGPLIKFVSG